jgi:hypothetical protein
MTFIKDEIYNTLHREKKHILIYIYSLHTINAIPRLAAQNIRCECINPSPTPAHAILESYRAVL